MNSKKLISIIIGTRPEAIKLATVIKAFKKCINLETRIILTGQHKEIVLEVLKIFDLHFDENLLIINKGEGLGPITCLIIDGLTKEFEKNKPDLVVVQGDTTSAFAGALTAFYKRIPVAHVEAGLRTSELFDPYPEEANRRLISQIATLHFAPTQNSFNLLKKIGVFGKVFLTGNTVIDAFIERSRKEKSIEIEGLDFSSNKVLLVTVHRRENWGHKIKNIALGLKKILKENKNISILLPMHPNEKIREILRDELSSNLSVFLVEPFSYDEIVSAIKKSYFLLTDSGGLQEEAPSLGKPVLVLRDTTERTEAIDAGTAKLVGTNPENIFKAANELINSDSAYNLMSKSKNPFGDGKASERIVNECNKFLNKLN